MQLNQHEHSNKKRLRIDSLVRGAVTLFGLLVLAMFLLIIFHMLGNTLPLFKKPYLVHTASTPLHTNARIQDAQQLGDKVASISYSDCMLTINEFSDQAKVSTAIYHHACASQFISVDDHNYGYDLNYAMLRSDGLVEIFSIGRVANASSRRLIASFNLAQIDSLSSSNLSEVNYAQAKLTWKIEKFESKIALYASLDEQKTIVIWHELGALALPQAMVVESDRDAELAVLPRYAQLLAVQDSKLHLLSKDGNVLQTLTTSDASQIRILRSPDENSVFIQEFENAIDAWRRVNNAGTFLFTKADSLALDGGSTLKEMVFSRQSMVASAIDADNNLLLINSASQQVVNRQNMSSVLEASVVDAQEVKFLHWYNQQLYVFSPARLDIFTLHNPAGITTLRSMFSELQYSGYNSAQYIWQTSQSAEYAQTKFSIIPLIVGSLKASVLALLVAVPLALGGAIYTAYFATVRLRNWLKPSIEMIEAIPSVIIGFVAAIWLAPFAERSLFALLGTVITLPILVLGMAAIHGLIKRSRAYYRIEKYYVFIIALAFLAVLMGVFYLITYIQTWIAHTQVFGDAYPIANVAISKTTVVVALALGIAVAPTIYSLVDDALFEVPAGIKQASFALGATEIQTLYRVVLLVALPSIISAIMLGLGRAFGETMILLMVTGNTPVANWDLLSGLRSLTSNLTIELQESSVGSEHYHTLFFTALILFAFTFIINTFAALLKRRLQRGNQHA